MINFLSISAAFEEVSALGLDPSLGVQASAEPLMSPTLMISLLTLEEDRYMNTLILNDVENTWRIDRRRLKTDLSSISFSMTESLSKTFTQDMY